MTNFLHYPLTFNSIKSYVWIGFLKLLVILLCLGVIWVITFCVQHYILCSTLHFELWHFVFNITFWVMIFCVQHYILSYDILCSTLHFELWHIVFNITFWVMTSYVQHYILCYEILCSTGILTMTIFNRYFYISSTQPLNELNFWLQICFP